MAERPGPDLAAPFKPADDPVIRKVLGRVPGAVLTDMEFNGFACRIKGCANGGVGNRQPQIGRVRSL